MEAKINIGEAASELASQRVKEHFAELNKSKSDDELDELIYVEDENGDTTYTSEAQDVFNGFYDSYEDLLLKCKV